MNEYQKAVKKKVDQMVKDLTRRMELAAGINFVERGNPYANWGVDEWLNVGEIHEDRIKEFPNARKAAELKKTKLYRALK